MRLLTDKMARLSSTLALKTAAQLPAKGTSRQGNARREVAGALL